MASIEEKIITKEILLKLIDDGYIELYEARNDGTAAQNVERVGNVYRTILQVVSEKE